MTRFSTYYHCSDCPEKFRTNYQLKMHFGNKHKNDVPSVSGSGE